MAAERNPVAVDAGQNPTTTATDAEQGLTTATDAEQDLITSVAETTGRVAAKVSNVIGSLTGAFKSRRKR